MFPWKPLPRRPLLPKRSLHVLMCQIPGIATTIYMYRNITSICAGPPFGADFVVLQLSAWIMLKCCIHFIHFISLSSWSIELHQQLNIERSVGENISVPPTQPHTTTRQSTKPLIHFTLNTMSDDKRELKLSQSKDWDAWLSVVRAKATGYQILDLVDSLKQEKLKRKEKLFIETVNESIINHSIEPLHTDTSYLTWCQVNRSFALHTT